MSKLIYFTCYKIHLTKQKAFLNEFLLCCCDCASWRVITGYLFIYFILVLCFWSTDQTTHRYSWESNTRLTLTNSSDCEKSFFVEAFNKLLNINYRINTNWHFLHLRKSKHNLELFHIFKESDQRTDSLA